MPILRLLITASILSTALGQGVATAAGPGGLLRRAANPAGNGEYIVSSQVVSDHVVSSSAESAGYVGDLSGASVPGGVVGVGIPRNYSYPDLFYNNYTQGSSNRTNAQMYVSPVPVPPHVGHTYVTYQPFMPEEMLYWHTNRYHNYYDGGRGMNHTKVHYYAPPVRTGVSNLYWNYLRIPR